MLRHALREEPIFAGPPEQAAAAFERARDLLFRYRFYPPSLVSAAPPTGVVREGDVLRQRIRAGPLRFDGQVRVVRVLEGPVVGYRYVALDEHPEEGEIEFRLRRDARGVRFAIESWSAPRHWLARLGAPVARLVQARATEGAFRRMREAAAG